jgi:hypothetical protein
MSVTALRSFARTDYVLVAQPSDAPASLDRACWYHQWADGPIEIVIRKHASDEQLRRIGERFGVPLPEMQVFREREAV